MQLTPQLATLLLLPRPIRDENRVSNSQPILLESRFILDFKAEITSTTPHSITLSPLELVARSADIENDALKTRIVAAERSRDILELVSESWRLPAAVRPAFQDWVKLVADHRALNRGSQKVMTALLADLADSDETYVPGMDPLPSLRVLAGQSVELPWVPTPPEIAPAEIEIRRRSEHHYRLQRSRSASARGFASAVRKAYRSRCAFCGFYAPPVKGRALPGVDAAHILPYGAYDLDVVANGLILCKLHHWAFDSHILLLSWSEGEYRVDIAADVEEVVDGDTRTLEELRRVCGVIPSSQLPSREFDRPSPDFIDRLYSDG